MMKKLEKMVKAYNKYAAKHGYSTIEVDYENGKVIGEFTPRDENTYKGVWGCFKNAMIAGHNGYLEADYKKIVKRLDEITQH